MAIDCTWFQTKKMIESITVDKDGKKPYSHINFIKLGGNYKTTFWRYQHNSSSCLATNEAVYYIYRELMEKSNNKNDFNNLEHILFFYALQFYTVYKHHNSKEIIGGKNKKFFENLKKVKIE